MNAPSGRGDRAGVILALDTATSRVVVALGLADGTPIGVTAWTAGQRHGETLLPTLGRVLDETGVRRSELEAIAVGTGPGTFTGLRVGIATAKGLAHGLGIRIVGVSTATALLDAAAVGCPAGSKLALLMPAGPQDRVLVDGERTLRLVGAAGPGLAPGTTIVAVDLPGRATPEEEARGIQALDGLAAAVLRRAATRLAAGDTDDLARLVPEYVTLPRGVARETGEVAWSRDRP